MRAGKRPSSAPKQATQPPEPPRYHAHIGKDAKGKFYFVGHQAGGEDQSSSRFTEITVVDLGRPFEIRYPNGKAGLVIEGMNGTNAEPWTPSTIVAGARQGWFGFRVVDPNESGGTA